MPSPDSTEVSWPVGSRGKNTSTVGLRFRRCFLFFTAAFVDAVLVDTLYSSTRSRTLTVATLARIDLFPIKSLAARTARVAHLLPGGALAHDRQFAVIDASGRFLNGKRTARVHRLGFEIDCDSRQLSLMDLDSQAAEPRVWRGSLDHDARALNDWLTGFFGEPASLCENVVTGFPDDLNAPGPTIVSTATLAAAADWFSLDLEETRARFRANFEIDGVPPFWEDRLYGAEGQPVRFRIGGVQLDGINPCQRCVVPSRHPTTGLAIPEFARRFADWRSRQLPAWAPRDRFDHFYRLAVNTRRAPGSSGELRVGDAVEILT